MNENNIVSSNNLAISSNYDENSVYYVKMNRSISSILSNQYELKIEKFNDENFLPHGMNFEICELKKLDNHLYKFIVDHPDKKYVDFHECIQDIKNLGVVLTVQMIEGEKPTATKGDYIDGKVKGGSILIHGPEFFKTVTPYLKYVNLKYRTMIFIILDGEMK